MAIINKVILRGRLTRDPEIRYTQGQNSTAVARYTLAVDRRYSGPDGNREADFISCVAFGKAAEFCERYVHKGTALCVCGRLQTGSYTNREGQKVYTTDVIVEEQEFSESRAAAERSASASTSAPTVPADDGLPVGDGFMSIPDGVDDSGLPFN